MEVLKQYEIVKTCSVISSSWLQHWFLDLSDVNEWIINKMMITNQVCSFLLNILLVITHRKTDTNSPLDEDRQTESNLFGWEVKRNFNEI